MIDAHALHTRHCRCHRPGRRRFTAALLGGGAALAWPAWAREGVDVGPRSSFSQLISADDIEKAAQQQYVQLLREADSKGQIAGPGDPQLVRLRAIAQRLIPFSYEWNERARQWRWEVNLIKSPQVNAFCMPGGKIAFFSGILDKLKLSDDEVAMVMGHEITHALREHARERIGKTQVTRSAIEIGAAIFGLGNGGRYLANMSGQLLTLQFGRQDESEADLVGMELAARAGYDPHAGVTLWQKMAALSKSAPPQWLSTHPSGPTRIRDIEASLPKVEPLYARAARPAQRFGPPG
ncbi:MAG TPA: M48 family metallopeptidase [Burkholderiaceae bacterium]|nr:M48 family metallopeptidase [Burkholderiaceae bacterium]